MAVPVDDLCTIASLTFMAVGPSRIAALTLVLAQNEPIPEDHLATAHERVSTAKTALEEGFTAKLKKADYAISPALEELRVAAAKACNTLSRKATSNPSELNTAFCLDVLEPAVTSFLNAMTAEFSAAQIERDDMARQGALNALKDADTVGRSIRMIAVNASIEAARAGDAGRGFMVIAKEIKTLAARTEALLAAVSSHISRSG